MQLKSLEELREADERTLRFAPLGLETGRMLSPEDATEYQQEVISHAELVPAVSESTRNTFDRLRMFYAYGVLCYELFTAVDDLAHLAVEQALRDRFLDFYGDRVPFKDADGDEHIVEASRYEDLYDEIHEGKRLSKPHKWRLKLRRTGELIYFDGMLDSLLRWARAEGLLRGQRNRWTEPLLKFSRNFVAHGAGDHLVMPVDAARTLSDLAEIINQLWGFPTPGGHLYPAPIRREIQAVAWKPSGAVMRGLAGNFPPADLDSSSWVVVLVRAVLHDEGLHRLDAQYETTSFPCDLLWGPGTWEDAAAWLSAEQPQADEVEILDRLFMLQYQEGRLYLPRNPDVAAGLAEDERQGTWYLVRADSPTDAIGHVRTVIAGQCTSDQGSCKKCAAEAVGAGSWQEMMDLTATICTITPRRPPDAMVPSILRWPRYFDVPTTAR